MNGTIEEPTPLKRPPGLENLIGAELARLAANPKLREVVRVEFSRRPELLEVACRERCGNRLRLSDSEPPQPNCRYVCKECCRDRSIWDTPSGIEKSLEGKSPQEQRKVLGAISSARRARGSYVDHADGTTGYYEAVYDQYRSQKVKEASKRWRKNNPEKAADYKRRQLAGLRSGQIKTVPLEAWYAKLEQLGSVCSACTQPLTRETAIRWLKVPLDEDGIYDIENLIPVCKRCRAKKAADKRWKSS
jgi:hypothetical protein